MSKSNLLIVGIVLVTLFAIIGTVFAFSYTNNTPEIAASSQVGVKTQQTSHDWGTIAMDDGKVEKVFTITNTGSETLKLHNAQTSCSCTYVQLIRGENKSPKYGMHTKSRYVLEVPPKETAQAKVVFDPAFHGPSGVGVITRQATIKTNSQAQPEVTFVTSANVVR